jgi:DNA polymerase III epsilon subunit-like protein
MGAQNDDKPIIVAFTLDFETGGLDCRNCACTQIAIHAVRIDTFETIDRYAAYISPYNKKPEKDTKRKVLKSKYDQEEETLMLYEEKALTYSSITMEMLESMGMDIKQVAEDVVDFIRKNTKSKGHSMKPFLIGQNVGFDIGFLQQLMEYAGLTKEFSKIVRGRVDFYGNFQPLYIDTIILGQLALSHLDGVTSYKLEIMAEKLGVELDDAHDADADVTATTNIAMVCTQRMRNIAGNDDGSMVMSKTEKSRVHFKI